MLPSMHPYRQCGSVMTHLCDQPHFGSAALCSVCTTLMGEAWLHVRKLCSRLRQQSLLAWRLT